MSRPIREIESDLADAKLAELRALAVEDTVRERNALPEFLSAARKHYLASCRRVAALHNELRKAQQEQQEWLNQAQAFLKRERSKEVKP